MKPILRLENYKDTKDDIIKYYNLSDEVANEVGFIVTEYLRDNLPYNEYIVIAGNGKNGLSIARHLHNRSNLANIFQIHNFDIDFLKEHPDIPIIDAIDSVDLYGPLKFDVATMIKEINDLPNFKIAIDIPTGLVDNWPILKVDLTLVLSNFKLPLLLPDNYKITGKTETINAGYGRNYSDINLLEHDDFYYTANDYQHKYDKGHLLIIGGEDKYIGATVLSAMAAVRTAGVVSVLINPKFRQMFPPEVIMETKFKDEYDAYLIGPGTTKIPSKKIVKILSNKLTVVDAGATTYFSPKKNIIFTPHLGEFKKMTKEYSNIDIWEQFENFDGNLLLKGPISYLNIQKEKFILNYPNHLLATAGSGDVLAGIVAGYLAKFKDVKQAAIMGILRHSIAGETAKNKGHKELCASQLISYL